MTTYRLSPSIGVARLGNSPTELYLAPERIGGLPLEADAFGNPTGTPFSSFRDAEGRVKRQAQPFRVLRSEDGVSFEEVTLQTAGVRSIEWTVHVANKKAAWYQFSELQGNLLLGEGNSYANQGVALRNKDVPEPDRWKLIIDPGPRRISGANQSREIDRVSIPGGYRYASFPNSAPEYGWPIDSLGTIKTDAQGRLLVLGGYGRAGGDLPIESYGGADTWHDDTSDGTVHCTLVLTDQTRIELDAWVICASPDFAPEIVNISTLDDTMFDVGVRYLDLVSGMYSEGAWNPDYRANFRRDILPIIQRISRYQWVSNVQSMSAFCSYVFDFADPSPANAENRALYFSFFRKPTIYTTTGQIEGESLTLWSDGGLPMMPLNSGSNSVNNTDIEKFLTLSQTQYFLLSQWAAGKFDDAPDAAPHAGASPATVAAVGNCVGLPMCPGIEVTWTMQNPAIYSEPYHFLQFGNEESYALDGLSPSRDETEGGGCEPGDLSKRMAIPWQADFFNCTVQYVNFTDPLVNKVNGVPKPPTYYTYWWPPQSPWDVLTGDVTVAGQAAAHTPAGLQVNYARGINSYAQMIREWSYLGFIRNRNTGSGAERFPYLVETERLHDMYEYQEVPVSQISHNPEDAETTIPVWYSKPTQRLAPKSASLLRARADTELFREIAVAESQRQALPRRGTRARR